MWAATTDDLTDRLAPQTPRRGGPGRAELLRLMLGARCLAGAGKAE